MQAAGITLGVLGSVVAFIAALVAIAWGYVFEELPFLSGSTILGVGVLAVVGSIVALIGGILTGSKSAFTSFSPGTPTRSLKLTLPWVAALFLIALLTACGGGGENIPEAGDDSLADTLDSKLEAMAESEKDGADSDDEESERDVDGLSRSMRNELSEDDILKLFPPGENVLYLNVQEAIEALEDLREVRDELKGEWDQWELSEGFDIGISDLDYLAYGDVWGDYGLFVLGGLDQDGLRDTLDGLGFDEVEIWGVETWLEGDSDNDTPWGAFAFLREAVLIAPDAEDMEEALGVSDERTSAAIGAREVWATLNTLRGHYTGPPVSLPAYLDDVAMGNVESIGSRHLIEGVDLNELRLTLEEEDFLKDEIKGVEVWIGWTGRARDGDAVAFLGETVLIAESKGYMGGVILPLYVRDLPSMHDDAGTVWGDLPDGIVKQLSTDDGYDPYSFSTHDSMFYAHSVAKQGDQFRLTGAVLFEDVQSAEDAEYEVDTDSIHDACDAQFKQDGSLLSFDAVCDSEALLDLVQWH